MRRRTLCFLVGFASCVLIGPGGASAQVIEQAKLLASDGAATDWFGSSVAVSGDTTVVGARGDDDSGFNSGSAYVYRYDGSAWVEEAKLLASDGAAGDFFGYSVAVSGDTAVVGAWYDDDSGSDSGSAYVIPLPEPSGLLMLAVGVGFLATIERRRTRP